ncbi:L-serine dehydratase [Silvibacterium bohemicum]|uniref:L-serine dehydratase n=1 Tax=Silvibacterium bohemicum TaxID=1577686 RepID=A0A841JVN4_9BACT|nr:L-serine ammonia-lyase [Silvibacterium bohemicum]MBB6144595.1 L-serine dehydratase [Silvibacterium bohemicum]
MKTSLFDLYKVGIGPSSSHTMGPMRAARRFAEELAASKLLDRVALLRVDLYGSLALTGLGHGTDRAVLLGLSGEEASAIDPATIEPKLAAIRASGMLALLGQQTIPFRESEHLFFHRDQMFPPGAKTEHPNGVRFTAVDAQGTELLSNIYFSIGGGFIVADAEGAGAAPVMTTATLPFPFRSAAELLELAAEKNLAIWQVMLANECVLRNEAEVRAGILHIWSVMEACIDRGIATEGILPGGLQVRRRAARLAQRLGAKGSVDPLAPLDWVTVYAMAINEENAAGGRVVTAPTNGAAGVIPAVARYYRTFIGGADEEGILRYFLTSAAIGVLYKENASISGAEVGCQGEVGVACSMAAGGLAAALGGSNSEVEHAAEIGMEHNLGMTCDPIGGLVQIPCIERNAMGAVKAVHACRIAMNETEGHKVSLDQVIKTMYLTGLDMQSRYKETSLAGLALNVIEC